MEANGDVSTKSDVPYCLLVPERTIGAIIGPKGQNVQQIQTDSGASIDVAKRHETGAIGFSEKLVVVKGDSEQKLHAVEALGNTVFQNLEKDNQEGGDGPSELVILLPSASVPLVIGTRGAKIKDLQSKSDATIDVSKSGVPGRCCIKGTMEQIIAAVQAIYDVVESDKRGASNFAPQAQLNSVAAPGGGYGAPYGGYGIGKGYEGYGGKGYGNPSYGGGKGHRQIDWHMVIPASCCSAVIGARGTVVNDIQTRSGASIDIPREGGHDGDKTIIIRGNDQSKSYGLDLILHQLAQCREFQQSSGAHAPPIRFQIPGHCAGKLVGPGGQTVQMIAQKN